MGDVSVLKAGSEEKGALQALDLKSLTLSAPLAPLLSKPFIWVVVAFKSFLNEAIVMFPN